MRFPVFILILAVACSPRKNQGALPVRNDPVLDSIASAFDGADLFHGSLLIARNGKILLDKRYPSDAEEVAGQTGPHQTYQIGSVTKQFTAAAILKLQEEGKLSVEDKLGKYFPELAFGDQITLHHLLTHTSGIFNYTNDTAFWLREASQSWSQDKMVARFADKPLDFEPGSRYSYSNSGYLLLGYIIEKITGKTYEQYIRQNIFEPLGMNRSGFDFNKAPAPATGYYDNGSVHEKSMIVDSTGSYAAGAMYSTTQDLYKWVQAIRDKKILRPESWEKAMTPFRANYGYGIMKDKVYGNTRIWHNGGIHGFMSNLEYFPDSNIVVITLCNFMQSDLGRLNRTLNAALLGKPYELPKQRTEIQLDPARYEEYAGTYLLAPSFSIVVTREGNKLMAQATGQQNFQLYPEKEDYFFYKVVDAQVKFNRDDSGKIISMTLFQGGREIKGEKIQ